MIAGIIITLWIGGFIVADICDNPPKEPVKQEQTK